MEGPLLAGDFPNFLRENQIPEPLIPQGVDGFVGVPLVTLIECCWKCENGNPRAQWLAGEQTHSPDLVVTQIPTWRGNWEPQKGGHYFYF